MSAWSFVTTGSFDDFLDLRSRCEKIKVKFSEMMPWLQSGLEVFALARFWTYFDFVALSYFPPDVLLVASSSLWRGGTGKNQSDKKSEFVGNHGLLVKVLNLW